MPYNILKQHFEDGEYPETDAEFIQAYPELTHYLLRFEYTINPENAGNFVSDFIRSEKLTILELAKKYRELAEDILETAIPGTLGRLPFEISCKLPQALSLVSLGSVIERLNTRNHGIDFTLGTASEAEMALAKIIKYQAKILVSEESDASILTNDKNRKILNDIFEARFEKITNGLDPEGIGLKSLLKIEPQLLAVLAYNRAQELYHGDENELLRKVVQYVQEKEMRTPEYYQKQMESVRDLAKNHYQDQLYQAATNMTTNQVCSLDERYNFLTKSQFFPHFPESLDGYSAEESTKNAALGAAYIAYKSSPAPLIGKFLSWCTGSTFSLSDKLGYGVDSESALAATSTTVGTSSTIAAREYLLASWSQSWDKLAAISELQPSLAMQESYWSMTFGSSNIAWQFGSKVTPLVSSSAFTALGAGISSYQTWSRGGVSDKASWQKLKKALKNDKGEKKFFKLKDDEWRKEMSFGYLDALYAFDTAFACQKLGLTDIEAYRSTDSSATSTLKDIKIASELDNKSRHQRLLFLAGRKGRTSPDASWDDFEFLKAAKKALMSKTKHAEEFFPEGVALDDSAIKDKYKQFLVSRLSMGDVRAPEGVTQKAFAQKFKCF